MEKRLLRSQTDRVIAGVCGGLATFLNLDSTLVRLIFAVLTLASGGTFLVVYIILWAITPEPGPASPPAQEETSSDELAEATEIVPDQRMGATSDEPYQPQAGTKPHRRDTRTLGWILLAVGSYFFLHSVGLDDLLRRLWPALLIIVGIVLLWPYLRRR
jgi:phage shock protein PspC (stress-responsive transcriptional regulator)